MNKNFLLLVIGNITSRIGSVIFDVTLIWWLTIISGSAKYAGLILAASLFPMAILSPLSGVVVDRINKRKILISADIISGVCCFILPLYLGDNRLELLPLIVICFLFGTCNSLVKPTIRSMTPQIISKNYIMKANSIMNGASSLSKILGALIASIFIGNSLLGVRGAMIFNGITYLFSAFCELVMTYSDLNVREKKRFISDLFDGFVYLKSKKIIFYVLILVTMINFCSTSFDVLLPLFSQKNFYDSTIVYTWTLTAFAMGGVMTMIVLYLLKNFVVTLRKLGVFIGLHGIALMLMSVINVNYSIVGLAFMYGFFVGLFDASFYTYVQENVESKYLGRVISLINTFATFIMPLSYMFYGYLSDRIVNFAFGYAGLGIVAIGLMFEYLNQRHLVQFEEKYENA